MLFWIWTFQFSCEEWKDSYEFCAWLSVQYVAKHFCKTELFFSPTNVTGCFVMSFWTRNAVLKNR